ncbi:MAG: hypothetical protein WB799_12065 [Candidatus Sulfotelmatobacter sp.]
MKTAAIYVRVSTAEGKLPGRKDGKQWRIPATAIEARLKQRGE